MSNENVAYDIPIQIQRPVGSTQTMVVGANGTLEVDGILMSQRLLLRQLPQRELREQSPSTPATSMSAPQLIPGSV